MNTENYYIQKQDNLYKIIWSAFLFELALFFVAEYFFLLPEIKAEKPAANDFNIFILYFSYLAVIISVPAIYKIYELKKKQAAKENNIEKKTEIYLATLLINFSVLEFAAVLSLIASYLNGQDEPLYMFGIIFIAVLLNKPSLKKFILSGKEYHKNNVIPDNETVIPETDENNLSKK